MIRQRFKVGDIVRYIPMGPNIYVLQENDHPDFPLKIKLEIGIVSFSVFGIENYWETHPLLVLIRREEGE